MPEHHDPIRVLEEFGTGGAHPAPLPATEVRRLGDRRRARRSAVVVAAAAVAVVAAVTPVALLSRHDDTHAGPATTTPATPAPSHASAPPQPAQTAYPGSGVMVRTAADTANLTGTSPDFRAFIAGQAAKAAQVGESCPDAEHGVTVQKYSSAGYAMGAFNACGGYAALWVRRDGAWGEGQSTQDAWDCDALGYLDVPASFAGPCAEESGSFGTPGGGGPEPGMTKAQAAAAGITVNDDAPAPPCSSTAYSSPVVPHDNTQGLFSLRDGLVQVAMTSAMKTEAGIGLGSARSKVLAAYPNRQSSGSVWIVPRPGGTAFLIRFGADQRVVAFTWELDRADCAGYMR